MRYLFRARTLCVVDIDDVALWIPGKLEQVREFFRTLNVHEGVAPHTFFDDGRFQDQVQYGAVWMRDFSKTCAFLF